MLPALLTAALFAFSAVFSQRAARLFGPLQANAARLAIATCVLGLVTLVVDGARGASSVHLAVYPALFVSGLVGFGLGDVGLFLAYPRLGSRLTILINFGTGTVFGALGDYYWLGQTLEPRQWAEVSLILAGLGVALWPGGKAEGLPSRLSVPGMLFALLAGFGQGFGTTLSGHANRLAAAEGLTVPGISQAFQRATAGVLVAITAWMLWKFLVRSKVPPAPAAGKKRGKHAPFWLAGTALFGPVLGVSCYQWARLELPSAIVVSVAATSTLLVIPLAKLLEKDSPTRRQTAGTLLAVAGVVCLCLSRGKPGDDPSLRENERKAQIFPDRGVRLDG